MEDVIKTLVRNILIGQEFTPGFDKVEQFKVLFQELLEQQKNSRNEVKLKRVFTESLITKENAKITEKKSSPSLDSIKQSLHDLKIAPYVLHLCLTQDLEVKTAFQIAISVEKKFSFDWLREKIVAIEPQNDWDLEYQDILISNLDSMKLLLLDVLRASSKIDFCNLPDDEWFIKSIEENSSSHLSSYFHALEQLRAGSSISLTTISVVLSRLDFLNKIKSTKMSGYSKFN